MKQINQSNVTFGCDPEFFFSRNGKIIGAEKVLPKDGMTYKTSGKGIGGHTAIGEDIGKVIIDGVQAELNPRANTCRANLANEISLCFRELYELMKKNQVVADFSPCIEISQNELSSLSEKSQRFGCAPSKNLCGESSTNIKDASKYLRRPAGGHIHLGSCSSKTLAILKDTQKLIPIMDIIVGNTCVLIDRDEANIERRKTYGRASEHRTPTHGIEYRTLSNFWLRAYPLMGLVMGLARQAVSIVESGYAKDFMALVDMKDIEKAINTNDYDLALINFEKILPLLCEITPVSGEYPIHKNSIDNFMHFINKGLDYWFNHDVVEHWIKLPEGHGAGFETFLSTTVSNDLKK